MVKNKEAFCPVVAWRDHLALLLLSGVHFSVVDATETMLNCNLPLHSRRRTCGLV